MWSVLKEDVPRGVDVKFAFHFSDETVLHVIASIFTCIRDGLPETQNGRKQERFG